MGLDDTIQFKMAIQQKFHFCDFRWPHPTTWDLNGYLNVARRSPAKDWGLGQDVRPGYSMISLKYRYWCILMYIDVYWCILMYIDVYWCTVHLYIDIMTYIDTIKIAIALWLWCIWMLYDVILSPPLSPIWPIPKGQLLQLPLGWKHHK